MSVSVAQQYHVEILDGQEVEKPLPKTLHGIVQARLIVELSKWTGELKLLVSSEQDVLCGTDRIVPDITLLAEEGPFEQGRMRAADVRLAIEIMSPGQTYGDLVSKCDRLHRFGTPLCWLLWPKKRKAWVYRPNEVPEEVSGLPYEEFVIPISVLYADLERYEALGAE